MTVVWTTVSTCLRTPSSSHTVFLVVEAEADVGSELKRSNAACGRGGLDSAGLSVTSAAHPPPLDTIGPGVSERGEECPVGKYPPHSM